MPPETDLQATPFAVALREPRRAADFDLDTWNCVVRQARNCGLLAKLQARFDDSGTGDRVPDEVRAVMADDWAAADRRQIEMRFEVNRLLRATAHLQVPIILLKGAAYLFAKLPPARGRYASDVDILAPADQLDSVEQALLAAGWISAKEDDYDQAYYRKWMHELPPLLHPERQTVIDLHHTILPRTSRIRPDAFALIADARGLSEPGLRVLAPTDMVIHSCLHLFHDGAFAGGLRDLIDLDELLRYFARQDGFWAELYARAQLHGALRPMFWLVHLTTRLLGTPVPQSLQTAIAPAGPSALTRRLMDGLVLRTVLPSRPRRPTRTSGFVPWLLYCRSQALRMPPGMLARHLSLKALRRAPAR